MVDEGFSSAAKLLGAIEIPSDHLLIMDEIGFLEEDSPEFQQAVVSALEERGIACVFLERATSHLSVTLSHLWE
jgi:nucleoside-triphosphatase THEP1